MYMVFAFLPLCLSYIFVQDTYLLMMAFFGYLVILSLVLLLSDIIARWNDPNRVAYDDNKVVIVNKKKRLTIPFGDIKSVHTSEDKNGLTTIKCLHSPYCNKYGFISLGWGTGGDFGLSLGEAFKKYMEEQGNSVTIENRYMGYPVKAHLKDYISSVDENGLSDI